MAAAHPEGEVYFMRSSLRFANTAHWSAERADDFYSHCLIEWVSNQAAVRQQGETPRALTSPRNTFIRESTSHLIGSNRLWFGFWRYLPVSLGEYNNIRRSLRLDQETRFSAFRSRDNGGAQHVWVHPCPLPTEQEKWMWIDLHAHIRAIYFPLSQVADEEFPNLCTYVQLNFYHQGVREVYRPEWGRFVTHEFTSLGGTGVHHTHAIGINVQECIKLLGLPPKLRVTNIWRERLIIIREFESIRSIGSVMPWMLPRRIFDFVDFINANFAVDVIWKPMPPQNSFLRNLIETVVATALGLVPGVGPLLSASFSVAWMAITDPDGFQEWAASGGWTLALIEVVIGSSDSMSGYVNPQWRSRRLLEATAAPDESALPEAQAGERQEPDWEQIGPSELLLSGLRIIAYSANSPKSPHDGQLHTEILRRAVKCGTISLPEALAVERGLEAFPEEDPEKDHEVEVSEVQELD